MKTLVHMMALILMLSACEKKTLLRIKQAVIAKEVPNHTVKQEAASRPVSEEPAESKSTPEHYKKSETNIDPIPKPQPAQEKEDTQPAERKTTQAVNDGSKYDLAVEAVKANDFALATKLYLQACEAGDMRGCHRYAYHQQKENNIAAAIDFYSKACLGGVRKACNNLGWTLEKQGHHAEAQNWYSWACLKSHPGSCANLRRVEDRAKAKLAH